MGTAEGTLSLRPIGKTSRGAIRLVFTKLAMLTLWALAIDQSESPACTYGITAQSIGRL